MPERPTHPNDSRMQSSNAPSHNYGGYSQQTNAMHGGSVGSNGTDNPAPGYGGGRTGADDYYAGSQPSYYQQAPSTNVPSVPAPSYTFDGGRSTVTAAHGSQAPSYAQYPPTPTASYARTAPMPWETERSDAISFATNAIHPVTPYVPDQNATSAAYAQMRPPAAQNPYGQQSSASRPTDYTANNSQQRASRRGQGGGQGG